MSTERETPESDAAQVLAPRCHPPALLDLYGVGTIVPIAFARKLERERDKARQREARWKAVARALYYAVGSDMEAKADQAFTALRSEVEG